MIIGGHNTDSQQVNAIIGYYVPRIPEEDFAPIDGYVEVVEPLGAEILLVVKCCDNSFLAMVDAEVEVKIVQTLRLNFNMAKMHVFDSVEPHRRLGI